MFPIAKKAMKKVTSFMNDARCFMRQRYTSLYFITKGKVLKNIIIYLLLHGIEQNECRPVGPSGSKSRVVYRLKNRGLSLIIAVVFGIYFLMSQIVCNFAPLLMNNDDISPESQG